jgi:hypothetical protein
MLGSERPAELREVRSYTNVEVFPGARPGPSPALDPDQDVSRFLHRWGGHLAACMIRIRARFDGDLDQYLIYLNFMLAELSQAVARADAMAKGHTPPPWIFKGMNALSLSEITGVPRETTRRKLQHLVEAGYLRRGGDGLFYLGGKYGLDAFFADLRPLFWDAMMPEAAG